MHILMLKGPSFINVDHILSMLNKFEVGIRNVKLDQEFRTTKVHRKMRRSRRAATVPEPNVPDEASAQDKAPAPRRRGRRPRATQVEEHLPPVQDQSFMAQGPIDPMATTLAGCKEPSI
ncbi:hypothetical protein GH714_005090 [Hevea brasiliensis]|uniref:Uncharacterized protein n=1 Tax=Hevea brasiliensis TaxID=3981 RepID=A0A6A6M967_HEVBR|nr:hypothetical protein GH714_005090 [Hevea brasiliensis]